jgi:hypothetical protein
MERWGKQWQIEDNIKEKKQSEGEIFREGVSTPFLSAKN